MVLLSQAVVFEWSDKREHTGGLEEEEVEGDGFLNGARRTAGKTKQT